MDIHVNALPNITELCYIMRDFRSDKGNPYNEKLCHTYTRYYYNMFEPVRNDPIRVFELGLGTNNVNLPSNMGADGKPGASLRGWAKFFPNSMVYGADIDRDILFEEDRIRTYYCNQESPEDIKAMWSIPELEENFDIIIDDAMHELHYNRIFFENSIHKLKVGGVYIIEDIMDYSMGEYYEQMEKWMERFPNYDFRMYPVEDAWVWNNCLMMIKRID